MPRASRFGSNPARYRAGVAEMRPITDEAVAVGSAFDSDAATGLMPIAPRVAGVLAFPPIVIHRQEVRPMHAVSAMGAPLQSTIPRLR
jgi:hypothetical protein